MSKDDLWRLYTSRNPSFNRPGNVTMSSSGLRKLFSQTWDIAYKAGGESKQDALGVFEEILKGKK